MWLIVAVLLCVFFVCLARRHIPSRIGIDDANIFMTYARNLVDGQGLVYNAGGERVEGFTSPLWLCAVSLATLAPGQMETLTLWFCCAGLVAAIVACRGLMTSILHQLHRQKPALVHDYLLLGWVFLTPMYCIWATVTLMDVALWSAVLLSGTWAAVRRAGAFREESTAGQGRFCGWMPLAVAAMPLVRPEGMLIALVWIAAVGWDVVWAKRQHSATWSVAFRTAMRAVTPSAAAYALVIAAATLFRLSYFGYPLPNTYYAKVSPNPLYNLRLGLGYLRDYLWDQPLAAISLSLAGLVLLAILVGSYRAARQSPAWRICRHQRLGGPVLITIATIMAATLAPVLTGGDHFSLYRFFQPAWPMLLLPLVIAAPQSIAFGKNGWIVVVTLLTVLGIWQEPTWRAIGPDIKFEFFLARSGRQLGEQLNQLFPSSPPSIGVGTTGGIGYTYRGSVIDLLGLNNVAMGHSPGDRVGNKNHAAFSREVFFRLRPSIFLPTRIGTSTNIPKTAADLIPEHDSFWDKAMKGLQQTDQFQAEYRPVYIPVDNSEMLGLSAWCLPEVIDRLRQDGHDIRILR